MVRASQGILIAAIGTVLCVAVPTLSLAASAQTSPTAATILPLSYTAPARQKTSKGIACNEIQARFRPDANTRLTLVRAFRKGEDLNLDGKPTGNASPGDVCMVKMIVGPGNPGPKGAPSTSEGIAIEIWLPSQEQWNNRIHAWGTGGFSGPWQISSLTTFGLPPEGLFSFAHYPAGGAHQAVIEGSVAAVNDGGHVMAPGDTSGSSGSFAMNPDGSVNAALWRDFSVRADHEMALKTKALVELFYGRPAARAYFTGTSGGGRQALKAAQAHPEDWDGILSMNPGIYWTRMTTAQLYPQIVIQRDLGGKPPTRAQLDLVSSAAVSACDTDINGQHAGWITDPSACRYDPTKDRAVLCQSDGGDNATPACLTRKIALAINKIWFGPTEDGSVPDPAVSIGLGPSLDSANKQLWYGFTRGTPLVAVAGSLPDGTPAPFTIATDTAALVLQDPKIGTPVFRNAKSNGQDGWKNLGYADLARAHREGLRLQDAIAEANTENPDLTKLRDAKAKLILVAATADEVVPPGGGPHYYNEVLKKMGALAEVQHYFRFYQLPGIGHVYQPGNVDGKAGVSPPSDPPFSIDNKALIIRGKMFHYLVDWVEKQQAPGEIVVTNVAGTASRPLCVYPAKMKYLGGDVGAAKSYRCVHDQAATK
ncbi:MAG TPA: tannase/feruloyl esterase family alpha/beta hydrolase [Steroidobacteraceae bacterium]|nr:tannase/feruloyl esterase family alpha/beta hydrolase [Steroidobacteraceae bacterium]